MLKAHPRKTSNFQKQILKLEAQLCTEVASFPWLHVQMTKRIFKCSCGFAADQFIEAETFLKTQCEATLLPQLLQPSVTPQRKGWLCVDLNDIPRHEKNLSMLQNNSKVTISLEREYSFPSIPHRMRSHDLSFILPLHSSKEIHQSHQNWASVKEGVRKASWSEFSSSLLC